MSKFISFMLVSLVVLLASCATVDHRKIMLLNNGSVNTAIVIRKDSRVFLQGDTLLLKRVGENKWSQSYNTVKDTIRVDRNHSKNGYRAQYARAVLLD